MWGRLEVQLSTSPIGYVRVELGGGEVGVAEHLLDAAKIGAALQQVRRERVTEQVRMDALRLEPRLLGEPAKDQEGTGTRQRAAARVQEELGTAPPVEVGAAHRDVAAERVHGGAPQRDEPLLRALADRPDDPLLEIDRPPLQPGDLADAEARSVEQLDEGAVAHRP